jgi:hypothetical protein
VQIEWKLKEIPYVAITTTPNNAKHSPNDSPILYFPICSEMNLIRQEMGEIQDFDCRCAKKGIPKVITSSLMIQQIKINNLCQCPRYIPSHKLNKLNWVKTGSDIVFLIFLIYLQTMPNMCKYLEMIRPTLYFSFAS